MKNTIPLTEKTREAFSKRIFAGLIDLALWIGLFIATTLNFGTVETVTQGSTSTTNATLTGLPLFIFALAWFCYFVILEWRFGGSVGKLLLGVRVVGAGGGKITLKQSAVRNVLRVIDAFPYIIPYLAGLIIVANDDRKRRLGDRAAGTLVVLK